ncbi:pkb-activating kinase-like protein [Mortierella polycephala]|uniref:non-specific serine/threonine protein kinase n=1 Tax=Mortierella polycephala TaxID=41804 RepID=A0A9P6Q8U0_9FUNG|nr:pkb-activating kinase-like protein [Mortierella polycephala]
MAASPLSSIDPLAETATASSSSSTTASSSSASEATATTVATASTTAPTAPQPLHPHASNATSSTTPPTSAPITTVATAASPTKHIYTTESSTSGNVANESTSSSSQAPAPVAQTSTAVSVRKRTLADYKLGRTLGEGSYSTVVAAVDLSNKRDYAIKVLDKRHIIREKKVKYVNIEKNTLYRLDHPGVVKLYSTFQDSSSLYYVLELCQNGELLTFIKKLGSFDENCTRFYAAQILTAIEYVHSRGIIHRDLKPENILLDHRMYAKLTDFGTAKMLESSEDGTESDRANSFVGTAEYVSPELLTEKAACKSSDLWALGCIIYQLLAGRPPFKGSNEYQTFQKIVKLEYIFPPGFPKVAMDLVSRLLVHDPNERLGANNNIDQLKEHPFFEGVQWSELWNMPAPKLMPYLPPTPTHNLEPLRSDHDACLWSMNRAGENLMVVDPFREMGDSGTSSGSVDQSDRTSMSVLESENEREGDGPQQLHTTHTKSAGVLEASNTSDTFASSAIAAATGPTTAASANSKPDPAENPKAISAMPPLMPKSASASTAVGKGTSPAVPTNGHSKNKNSNSRNVFVALFTSNKKHQDAGKKTKDQSVGEHTKREAQGIARENSSVSLAVTANEISAYSKRSQLELQTHHSPWQSFLMPAELIIHQTPVLKRKGLFSRSCILVLTDLPRLLYFDDSNHYFAQLFNNNTNEAYSCWSQQQKISQWEHAHQAPQSQQPQLHASSIHAQARRNTGGPEDLTNGSGGFVLTRNGTHKQQNLHHQSEHVVPVGPHVVSGEAARASHDNPPHQHSHAHPHSYQHQRHQSNGHNKIDVDKRSSTTSASASGSESLSSGPLHVPGNNTDATAVSSLASSLTNAAVSTSSVAANESGSHPTLPSSDGQHHANGVSPDSSASLSHLPVLSAAPHYKIKASKRQAKLRGEIPLSASSVVEIKGKKCFFIHTTKKSYYFEGSNLEGDAQLWVKILKRYMSEWFGGVEGNVGIGTSGSAPASDGSSKAVTKGDKDIAEQNGHRQGDPRQIERISDQQVVSA